MSQRITTKTKKRRSLTYLWILGLALAVFALIYFEKTELLYVLATLGVTALLVIVATADLGAHERSDNALPSNPQASGSGVSSNPPKVSSR
jgi:peptidoglycan/LPS O-acetylase OafA/YrhL